MFTDGFGEKTVIIAKYVESSSPDPAIEALSERYANRYSGHTGLAATAVHGINGSFTPQAVSTNKPPDDRFRW